MLDTARRPTSHPLQITPGTNFNKINWLKAGILACDKLLTVSPNYATEIASGPQLGVELDKWVRVSAQNFAATLSFASSAVSWHMV